MENGRGRKAMGSVDRVTAAAEAAGLAIAIREMPASTRTAEDAAAACGVTVGQIVKSLVFRLAESATPVLLLVSGANRVDQAAMRAVIGETLERMDAEEVRKATGFAIGGVAPLGALAPLPTYMDADLMDFATIWAAAGAPHAVFETTPQALAAATGASIISLRQEAGAVTRG
jgi:prolyl-tRNA editing enzyme YbaK/EbsC (Cys-tRNA(Pro) deacylase)